MHKRTAPRRGAWIWVGLLGLSMTSPLRSAAAAEPGSLTVDFRYAPPWWQTAICLPDDWQKTLVGKEGALLYDFPGRHSGFKTRVAVGLEGESEWVRQELVSPRVPIVRTTVRAGAIEMVQEAFAVAPPPASERGAELAPGVQRVGSASVLRNWAAPTVPCDPAFRHIAVGWKEPIRYRFRAGAGARYTVVLGLCEGWHPEPGRRVLDLQVEGKTRRTVDLVREYGRNVPVVLPLEARDENADGWIEVAVAAAKDSPDDNTILNVLWVFAGEAPAPDQLLAGKSDRPALVHVACGLEDGPAGPPRHDVLLVRLTNTGPAEARVTPLVTLESERQVAPGQDRRRIAIDAVTQVTCTGEFEVAERKGGRLVLRLAAVTIPAGGARRLAVGVARGRGAAPAPQDVAQAEDLRTRAEAYWCGLDLPYGHIEVPDPGIQALLDSSIRNIYQAREIKDGLPAFQVGPTCYRGLWVVDGSFLMEAVTLLGRGEEARSGIRYLLKRQRDDGGFMLIDGHWKETGIVLWAVAHHARLTGDRAWLRQMWPNVERAVGYVKALRTKAATDPAAPNYRLVPAGFSDGGLGEKAPEYTNVYWTLAGLRAAVDAARWVGNDDEAKAWQTEYDDFYATFRKAAARDTKTDARGNRCLPIYMENGLRVPPQKAQWAFLHAVYPGQVFAPDDPLVRGNMAMLRSVECEGLVLDTGWIARGLWNYFGSFYAHAWLWLGDREKAVGTLYAFANHASPLLVWREEQMPQGQGARTVGDMPHNWASAEFIRLVRHLLVLERSEELHLLEGLPAAWVRPGMVTRLRDVATEFGPLSLELRVSADGATADLSLDPPRRNPPRRIALHTAGWADAERAQGPILLSPTKPSRHRTPLGAAR